jgi:hypothetical protein
MVACSKGYILSKTEQEGLLHFTGLMAVFNHKHLYARRPVEEKDSLTLDQCIPFFVQQLQSLQNVYESNIAMSFMMRITYGGTTGDLKMLYRHGKHILTMEQKDGLDLRSFDDHVQQAVLLTSAELPRFQSIHKLPQAVDFHCTTIVHDVRNAGFMSISKTAIKEEMWHRRSNVNFRQLDLVQENCAGIASLNIAPPLLYPRDAEPLWWQPLCNKANALCWKHWKEMDAETYAKSLIQFKKPLSDEQIARKRKHEESTRKHEIESKMPRITQFFKSKRANQEQVDDGSITSSLEYD